MREVCVVVPCFNEEKRLRGQHILDFVAAHPRVSVCFVDDGSSDGTLKVLEDLQSRNPERVLVRGLKKNRGKAEAVRQGVLHVSASRPAAFIGYWDADLSTPLDELDHLLAAFEISAAYVLAMGSRVKRLGSEIDRKASRHYLGRVFSTLASQLLNLPVYDSQCGAKVFRSDQAAVLFGEPFVTTWLFDVELLARLRNHLGREAFLRAVIEVPLNRWSEVAGSKLRLTHMLKVPYELLQIRAHYVRSVRS
jgi:glycosyltransferase involved in cell wall biosynthesis